MLRCDSRTFSVLPLSRRFVSRKVFVFFLLTFRVVTFRIMLRVHRRATWNRFVHRQSIHIAKLKSNGWQRLILALLNKKSNPGWYFWVLDGSECDARRMTKTQDDDTVVFDISSLLILCEIESSRAMRGPIDDIVQILWGSDDSWCDVIFDIYWNFRFLFCFFVECSSSSRWAWNVLHWNYFHNRVLIPPPE